jgi:hypothetical protein
MVRWLVCNALKRMWKEADIASFEILSQHLPGGTEENNVNPQSG